MNASLILPGPTDTIYFGFKPFGTWRQPEERTLNGTIRMAFKQSLKYIHLGPGAGAMCSTPLANPENMRVQRRTRPSTIRSHLSKSPKTDGEEASCEPTQNQTNYGMNGREMGGGLNTHESKVPRQPPALCGSICV